MTEVDLTNLLIAFSKSYEDACMNLKKEEVQVDLEEVEFTFDVQVDFDPSIITMDAKKNIKGIKFKKVAPISKVLQVKEANTPKEGSTFQMKLVLSNNM
ncbi:hypothetical protein R9C00_17170 [Flammeovirgaceae bacterium SG7u.111]|nr:hypothetical protein [Flammeovirgaceae bacterium SG7u.132]WPO33433.1 hypothetical protein R9C00_17170 [Flammeovirgaceae bacterium SG7u.111]